MRITPQNPDNDKTAFESDWELKEGEMETTKTECPVCGGYMVYIGQGNTKKCEKCGYKGHAV